MKKFLVMFAIAGALVACNNSGEGDKATDSPATTTDTNTMVTPAPVTVDTTGAGMTTDTSMKSGDTTSKK